MVNRIIVISDTHFGEKNSTLSRKETVNSFLEELSNDSIDELILLGDIFELWKSTPDKAFSSFKYFISKFCKATDKITYVIGNHDHHVFLMCQENNFLKSLGRSEFENMNFSPEQNFKKSIFEDFFPKDCEFDMRYARYWKKHLGKKLLFMHGHHLDGLQIFAPGVITRLRLFIATICGNTKHKDLLKDENFELALASTYETLYGNAFAEEIITVENGLWQIPSFFGLFKSHICKTLRFTPIQQKYFSIKEYTSYFKDPPDIFIFGHTHTADAYKKKDEILAVNTGCWLKEEKPEVWNNPEEIPNTYVVIDDSITVMQLGREEPIAGPFSIKEVATLEFEGRKNKIGNR